MPHDESKLHGSPGEFKKAVCVCKRVVGQEEEEIKNEVILAVFSLSYLLLVDSSYFSLPTSFLEGSATSEPLEFVAAVRARVSASDIVYFSNGTR